MGISCVDPIKRNAISFVRIHWEMPAGRRRGSSSVIRPHRDRLPSKPKKLYNSIKAPYTKAIGFRQGKYQILLCNTSLLLSVKNYLFVVVFFLVDYYFPSTAAGALKILNPFIRKLCPHT